MPYRTDKHMTAHRPLNGYYQCRMVETLPRYLRLDMVLQKNVFVFPDEQDVPWLAFGNGDTTSRDDRTT